MRTHGIERERFIMDINSGQIVPEIGALLLKVQEIAKENGLPKELFTYELFAGQIEDRTLPCSNLKELGIALKVNDQIMLEAANQLGLAFDHSEIVEVSRITSLEVNSFDSRHKGIWKSISLERKIAASVVAATHIHISVSKDEIVDLLNLCREDIIDSLIDIGDHSNYKRIDSYRAMAGTKGIPPTFSSFAKLMDYINAKGGEKDVWDLVRYKPSTGTIEFRMFGSTQSVKEVLRYVKACLNIFKI